MTALGAMVLRRTYFARLGYRLGGYNVDRSLGMEGYLTSQATRLICLLAGQNAVAKRLLAKCCDWKISDETIRRACRTETKRITDFRSNSPAVGEEFAGVVGDLEF